jgi:hypothetical protein
MTQNCNAGALDGPEAMAFAHETSPKVASPCHFRDREETLWTQGGLRTKNCWKGGCNAIRTCFREDLLVINSGPIGAILMAFSPNALNVNVRFRS